jgi:hypothetical protein
MEMKFFAFFLRSLLCTGMALAATHAAGQAAALGDDERSVLSAAISARLTPVEKRIGIFNDTASFRCDGSYVMKAGGCNGGMRTKDQPVEGIISWLAQRFPGIGPRALQDFRTRNESSAAVARLLELNAKQSLLDQNWHAIAGEALPEKGAPLDAAFLVSRVGFDPDGKEAVAYVGGIGWGESKQAYGEYLHLRKEAGRWKVVGHAPVWSMNK